MDDLTQIKLSEQGARRRKAMLAELQSNVVRESQWRKQKQTLLWLGAAMFLMVANIWTWNWGADQRQNVVDQAVIGTRPVAVQTDGSSSDPPFESNHLTFEKISDDELLRTLSNMGQPSVLGTIGGETRVISQLGP